MGDAAIGDDLDIAVHELEIQQDARVFLRVPYPQERKHLQRPRPRRHAARDWQEVERTFHRKADLTPVTLLRCGDGRFDA